MAARFARLGRPGIYFRVEEPGTVWDGHLLTLLEAVAATVTILRNFAAAAARSRWTGGVVAIYPKRLS